MKVIILIFALAALVLSQSPPVWPERFQQDFVESYTTTTNRDIGKIWFDSKRNLQRTDRTNGRWDSFCNTIQTSNTPCTHLVLNSNRWIIFPVIKQCCFCCNATNGCGILRRDWLMGSKFAGKEDLSGQTFDKFVDAEAQIDYWATTDSLQIPRKLIMGKAITKDFIMNTFSTEYIADSVFAAPSFCNIANKCPGSCATLR